jgi:RNA polymerase sigma-70 factor (sigma-E family)
VADDDAYTAFVRARYGALLRSAVLLVGDRGRAEDVVQAALVRTYAAWGRLRDQAKAEAYTRVVLVRLAGRAARRRWHGELPTAELPELVGVSDGGAAVDDALLVRAALSRLPWAQRAVLVLRYLDDRPEAEVAQLLGCSVGTVKSRASRALAALRAQGLLADEAYAVDEAEEGSHGRA